MNYESINKRLQDFLLNVTSEEVIGQLESLGYEFETIDEGENIHSDTFTSKDILIFDCERNLYGSDDDNQFSLAA